MTYLLTPPAAEPVTLSEAKLALRIDHTAFDARLPGLISDARQQAEQETGRAFVSQTWRTELADWPAAGDEIAIYRPTTAAVSYWDGATWTTLATNAYVFAPTEPTARGTVLVPALGASWPALGDVAIGPRVRIDLTVGVAALDAGTVPECVKQFIIGVCGQALDDVTASSATVQSAYKYLAHKLDSQRLY